jgi:hypothetical protein
VRAIGAPPPAFVGVAAPAPAAQTIDPDDYTAANAAHRFRDSADDDGLA